MRAFFKFVVVLVRSKGVKRLAEGAYQAHHFIKLHRVGKDATQAFGVDRVERCVE